MHNPSIPSFLNQDFKTLTLKNNGKYLVISFNRPDSSNALNTQMALELGRIWSELYVDTGSFRAVILTGSKTKEGKEIFCAGADLKERNNMTFEQWKVQHAIFEQTFKAMLEVPIPLITAVNGVAFGGGCEMVLASDFCYASTNAKFALPEGLRGIIPGCFGTQLLPRSVGVRRAKELILTGRAFSAAEALEWGMVNKLCEASSLLQDVENVVKEICENASNATKLAKKSLNFSQGTSLSEGYNLELELHLQSANSPERLEGIRAFVEKRPAKFS